jgi:excisionase family DNA binding protein
MRTYTFDDLPETVNEINKKLDRLTRLFLLDKKATPLQRDKLLTIEEASKMLTLKKSTIYVLVSKKKIPVSKKGKRLYFSSKDLEDWIREGRNATLKELDKRRDSFLNSKKK